MSKINDIEGKMFNGLKVLGRDGSLPSGDKRYNYLCHCGEIKQTSASALRLGNIKSCGCKRNQYISEKNSTHGKSKTKLYSTWKTMKYRCENPNVEKYERYGARGIKVCDEWKDYEVFYKWAKENGYDEKLTIDRINNDGDYEPSNCRWINYKEQSRNRSDNRWIVFNGYERILQDWSELTGLGHKTISTRLKRGWSIERALTTNTPNHKTTTKEELLKMLSCNE